MSIQKTYVFLVRFLIVLILFFLTVIIYRQIWFHDPDIESHGVSFDEVPDKIVDSIISNLTISEKLSLIIQHEFVDGNDLSRYCEIGKIYCDSLNIAQDSVPEIDSLRFKLNLAEFLNLSSINAICDTSFIAKYLLTRSMYCIPGGNNLLSIRLDTSSLVQFPDSVFTAFFNRRFSFLEQQFRINRRVIGLGLKQDQLIYLKNYFGSGDSVVSKLSDGWNKNLDLLFIDSLYNFQELPSEFNGLVVIRPSRWKINDNDNYLKFFKSRADIILVNNQQSIEIQSKIIELISKGLISNEDIDQKIRKPIKASVWMNNSTSNKDRIKIQTHSEDYYRSLFSQKSLVLLCNPDSLLPVKDIHKQKFTVIWFGDTVNKEFITNCNYYLPVNSILIKPAKKDWQTKVAGIQKQNFCIYVVDEALTDSVEIKQFKSLTEKLNKKSSVIINFQHVDNLLYIPDSIATIQSFSALDENHKFAAQAVFGGIPLEGQFPFALNNTFCFGLKQKSQKTRLKYSLPEEVGIDAAKLDQIDKIVFSGISGGAFPGCQVFVAKKGQVIYNKSFGYHTYSKDIQVSKNDLFDLASVTKIAATTIAAMKMAGDGKISLADPLGKFFKDTKIDYTRIEPDTVIEIDTFPRSSIVDWKKFLSERDTINIDDSSFVTIDTVIYKLTPRLNIFKVPLVDLLKHQSGIVPALPIFRYIYYKAYFLKLFYKQHSLIARKSWFSSDFNGDDIPGDFPENFEIDDSLKNVISKGVKKLYNEYFSTVYVKDSSDIRLTDNLFLRNKYFDTIWRDTKQLPVFHRKVFIYSDINMILLQLAMDSLNKQNIDQYLKGNIYQPLGLRNISYQPLKFYPRRNIVPTEQEQLWRFGYLHGYVHDPSAALLGGIAGNAGLFASANDLGILFQMVLNQGTYGGKRYLKPYIISQFTKRLEETQRGLGFDMPNRKAKVGRKASLNSYGHSGYTGTCVWVDPENEIVYVFLANRNHPKANNWRINSLMIRERIHDAIYDSIIQ